MTQHVQYPSEAFPAEPTIGLDIPDNWEAVVIPGSVLAVARELEEGVFRPNIVISVTRFTGTYDLQVAIDAVVAKFASLEDAKEIGRDISTIGDREWAHIESTFIDPRAGTLVQAAHLTVVRHGAVTDLVQATGSVNAAQAQGGVLVELRNIQRSITATASA